MAKKQSGNGWTLIPAEQPTVKKITSISPEEQKIKIFMDKRKKGKIVTVIGNIILCEEDMKNMAKSLKVYCGTGGTYTDCSVELQGDATVKAKEWLSKNNWSWK